MATSAKDIGQKYGKSVGEFETSSKNAVEEILLQWGNDSIALMAQVIRSKARTGGASTLAQDMVAMPEVSGGVVKVKVVTGQDYHDYVDKGVKGVKSTSKAPKSKYKFKNLGVPPAMWKSFVKYNARTGVQAYKGKSLSSKKQHKITAAKAQITAAKAFAVATKIGGIKPMNYKAAAMNKKRLDQLTKDLSIAMANVITGKIKQA